MQMGKTMEEKAFREHVSWVMFLLSILVIWAHSYNAELFSGIAGRNRTEYITAGRIFAGQPGFTCTVTGAEFIINIDVYILQGRTDGDVRFLESVRKL